jgi:hypothetical protein
MSIIADQSTGTGKRCDLSAAPALWLLSLIYCLRMAKLYATPPETIG